MKTSQRLQQIDTMITQRYDHIWDCCCDHGLLGYRLLRREATRTVHFVDVVEPLIAEVRTKLQRFFTQGFPEHSWEVHCTDVAALQVSSAALGSPERSYDSSSESTHENRCKSSHLMVIAGVGGDLLIELVRGLLNANPDQNLEFLLCPVYHNYKVREALVDMGFGLLNENLMRENNHFYEIMHVSTDAREPISLAGSMMWDFSREDDREYLARTINHYQRMSKNPGRDVQRVIDAYQALGCVL
ncbi:tRNA (adenine(22)-N(1))-methyltransferase TrmK [Neptunomonas antarctica]|uniref:tRNA (Adenine22-N1)-methyltransferase n=1 Tax=Neptunomonas antarctica TaxID=619304 RepID=A0A1N7NUH0_9GAMM|nr:tRNA (adenine(22)-N(1))-methyltransferase TrmK [Neptunomonas antarctica]SIT01869.1 tRNA (adenine22-N1)-methyltransferase [Neptunomonas antarctica]